MLGSDGFERAELVDARVVDKHVDGAEFAGDGFHQRPMAAGSDKLAWTAIALPPAALIAVTTFSAASLLPE